MKPSILFLHLICIIYCNAQNQIQISRYPSGDNLSKKTSFPYELAIQITNNKSGKSFVLDNLMNAGMKRKTKSGISILSEGELVAVNLDYIRFTPFDSKFDVIEYLPSEIDWVFIDLKGFNFTKGKYSIGIIKLAPILFENTFAKDVVLLDSVVSQSIAINTENYSFEDSTKIQSTKLSDNVSLDPRYGKESIDSLVTPSANYTPNSDSSKIEVLYFDMGINVLTPFSHTGYLQALGAGIIFIPGIYFVQNRKFAMSLSVPITLGLVPRIIDIFRDWRLLPLADLPVLTNFHFHSITSKKFEFVVGAGVGYFVYGNKDLSRSIWGYRYQVGIGDSDLKLLLHYGESFSTMGGKIFGLTVIGIF